MTSKEPFSGEGHDKTPLAGDEAAKHRHMLNEVSRVWPVLEGLSDLRRGGLQVLKISAVLAGLGAVVAYISKSGLLL